MDEALKNQTMTPFLVDPGLELAVAREGYMRETVTMIKKDGTPKPYLPNERAHIPLD